MKTSTVTCYSYNNRQGVMVDTEKRSFWYLTLAEILTILCAAAIPITLGIYTAISSEQQQKQADQIRQFDLQQAAELRQQELYDKFLNDMYNLEKDGYLADDKNPWVFANAYHRAAHRQWDAIRRSDVLQFLKEKQLIGKTALTRKRLVNQVNNTIKLNKLNFDNLYLTSQTGSLNQLDLTNVSFDQVSMVNTRFSFVNLDTASFNLARLNYAKFDDSSLVSATFDSTELQQTNFGNSDLTNTTFLNANLFTAILTYDQLQQAIFINTILPNGTLINSITTTTTTTTTTTDFNTSTITIGNTTTTTPSTSATTYFSVLPIVNETTATTEENVTTAWSSLST